MGVDETLIAINQRNLTTASLGKLFGVTSASERVNEKKLLLFSFLIFYEQFGTN